MDPATYFSANGEAVKAIVEVVKSEGIFDAFRKECTADVDTKPAYQNLRQRVEDFVSQFLSSRVWTPELNKNALRDVLRLQINHFLKSGVERVVSQLVNLRVEKFLKPQIEAIVANFLGIDSKEEKKKPAEVYAKPLQHHVALVPPTVPQMPASMYSFNLLEPPPPMPLTLPAPPRADYLMPPLPPTNSSHPTPPPLPEDYQPPPPPSDDDMDISDGDDEASAAEQKPHLVHSDDLACADGVDQYAAAVAVHGVQGRPLGDDVSSLAEGLGDYLASQEGYSTAEHHVDVVAGAAVSHGELISFEASADCIEESRKDGEMHDAEEDSLAGICTSDGSVALNNKGGEPGQIYSEDSMESADNHAPSHDIEKEVESGEVHTDDSKSSLLSASEINTSRRGRPRAGDTATEQATAPSCRREVRRNRTRNRKYTSNEFTSIFSQKKQLLCDSYVADVVEEGVVEEIVTTEDNAVLPSTSRGHMVTHSSDLDDDVALDGGRGRTKEADGSSNPGAGAHFEGWQPGSRPSSANSHESNQSSSGGHSRSASRSKSDSGFSVDVRPSPSATRTATQRYDTSDLYKPRVSHRKPIEQPSSPSSAPVPPPSAPQHPHSVDRRRKRALSGGDGNVVSSHDCQESDRWVPDSLQSAQVETKRRRRSTLTTEVPVAATPAAANAVADDPLAASSSSPGESSAETGDITRRGIVPGSADTRTPSGGSHLRRAVRDGSQDKKKERRQDKKHTFERNRTDTSSKKSRTKSAHNK